MNLCSSTCWSPWWSGGERRSRAASARRASRERVFGGDEGLGPACWQRVWAQLCARAALCVCVCCLLAAVLCVVDDDDDQTKPQAGERRLESVTVTRVLVADDGHVTSHHTPRHCQSERVNSVHTRHPALDCVFWLLSLSPSRNGNHNRTGASGRNCGERCSAQVRV